MTIICSAPNIAISSAAGPASAGEAERDIPFVPGECLALDPARPNVVVLGDSYAAQYWRAFALRYPERNVMQANASGCRPLLGAGGEARCREVVDHVLGTAARDRAGGDGGRSPRAGWTTASSRRCPARSAISSRRARASSSIGPTVEYEGEFPSILARSLANRHPMLYRPLARPRPRGAGRAHRRARRADRAPPMSRRCGCFARRGDACLGPPTAGRCSSITAI